MKLIDPYVTKMLWIKIKHKIRLGPTMFAKVVYCYLQNNIEIKNAYSIDCINIFNPEEWL